MDTLQAGFQTAPVKLPLTPYQKATKAREAIADLVQQQMQAVSGSEVCSFPSQMSVCCICRRSACRNGPAAGAPQLYTDLQLRSI